MSGTPETYTTRDVAREDGHLDGEAAG